MTTNEPKLRKAPYTRTRHDGRPLKAYTVSIDGKDVALVFQVERRATHTGATNIAIGYSYRVEWEYGWDLDREFPQSANRSWPTRTRQGAIERLLRDPSLAERLGA